MNDARPALTAIFAKEPVPGRVKTRLAPAVELGSAAGLARAMLRDLARRLRQEAGAATGVAFAPPEAEAWFRAELPGLAGYWAQVGSGLAERLASFFAERLAIDASGASGASGARAWASVVVVGADAPLLPLAHVQAAHAALAGGRDLVLAPDSGGGYCLVGLARSVPSVFLDVAMSTGDMFERTLDVARGLGLATEVLAPWFDVDVPQDLERLAHEIATHDPSSSDYPHETARWLAGFRGLR